MKNTTFKKLFFPGLRRLYVIIGFTSVVTLFRRSYTWLSPDLVAGTRCWWTVSLRETVVSRRVALGLLMVRRSSFTHCHFWSLNAKFTVSSQTDYNLDTAFLSNMKIYCK